MCFFFPLEPVVCSSDWGRLGGRVLIIWMLWSHQSERILNKQHLILNISCHRCTSIKPCRIISKKSHFFQLKKSIFLSFFLNLHLMPKWVAIRDEPNHTSNNPALASTINFLTFRLHFQVSPPRRRALIRRLGNREKTSPFGKVGCCSLRPICWVWDADFICWRRGGG